jgi:hypothetical protein
VLIVLIIFFSACGQQDDELSDLDQPLGPPTIVIRANLDAVMIA